MREILFRGKRIDNGKWVEGHLVNIMGYFHLIPRGSGQVELDCPVDPDTVGQYTGVKDKNGKRIFEGDVVKYEPASEEYGGKLFINTVVWDEDRFTLSRYSAEGYMWNLCTIIGNIHDTEAE